MELVGASIFIAAKMQTARSQGLPSETAGQLQEYTVQAFTVSTVAQQSGIAP